MEACNVCVRRCVKSNRRRKGRKGKDRKGKGTIRGRYPRWRKRCSSIHETKSAVIRYTVIPLRVFTIVLIVIAISHGARVTGIGLMLSLSVIWPRYRRSSSLGDVSDRRGDVPIPSSPPSSDAIIKHCSAFFLSFFLLFFFSFLRTESPAICASTVPFDFVQWNGCSMTRPACGGGGAGREQRGEIFQVSRVAVANASNRNS